MRCIFFDDELEHFRDTVISLLAKFLYRGKTPELIDVLHPIMVAMENNPYITLAEIKGKTNPTLIYDLMTKKTKQDCLVKNQTLEQISEELQKIEDCISKDPLAPLTTALEQLFYGIENRNSYLEKHQSALKSLEQCQGDGDNYDWKNKSRLQLAIERGDINKALYFINQGLYINQKDKFGRSPLMVASQKGYDTVVVALLNQNADINACAHPKYSYKTALLEAITAKHQSTVNLLIDAGARTNIKIEFALDSAISLQDYAEKKGIHLNGLQQNTNQPNN